MKIKCLIVDDEPLARKGLAEYIEDINFIELIDSCENAIAAGKIMSEQKIDLVFLDIQMPKMNGISFLKTLREPPMAIFTTAYTEYALQSYELDILDYLVKPISFERFSKAVNKAKEFYEMKTCANENKHKLADHFFIRCSSHYEKIFFSELLFAEALENYVVLQTTSQKYISYLTFKAVEDYLPTDRFIKVHKSFIIAISKIEKIEGNEIKIAKYCIPISRGLKEEVMDKVVKSNLLKR